MTDGLTEPEFIAEMSIQGYSNVRRLADGRWIGTQPMLFTVGLFVGLHRLYYDYRYCYPPDGDWQKAVILWDGREHPPGNWIKRKGLGEDLENPNR